MASWWAGAIIWKKKRGRLYFLVINARSTNPKYSSRVEIKFPGGNSSDHLEDRNPVETLRRELKEETHLRLMQEPEQPLTMVSKGDHIQYFYLIHADSLQGKMRSTPGMDGETHHSAPRWVRANSLVNLIYSTHLRAFHDAVDKLKVKEPTLVM